MTGFVPLVFLPAAKGSPLEPNNAITVQCVDYAHAFALDFTAHENVQAERPSPGGKLCNGPKIFWKKVVIGSPGRIRTSDQPVNSRLLYH
jgi:hypothetical protein